MTIRLFLILPLLAAALSAFGADPMATNFTYDQCEGSLTPYPDITTPAEYPDTLKPVMISHVGRHGARYPAGAAHTTTLRRALLKADSLGTITPLGRELLALTATVIAKTAGQWGALDSLGMAEQRGIASRMYAAYPELFQSGEVSALSSYAPRCMMSMYSFTHQLCRLSNKPNFTTTTGRMNNDLMRPFDVAQDYIDLRKGDALTTPYNEYFDKACPTAAIERVLGASFPYASDADKRNLAIIEYYVLAGLRAMSLPNVMGKYLKPDEANALWSCFNLRQYLQRTASTVSAIPAEIASTLLLNIIDRADTYLSGQGGAAVQLRFGHAETLMPLLSLMRLSGCYYMTNYFDTVAQHWQDFYVVPMASNLQLIFFSTDKGKIYVRVDLNERPVPLIPNSSAIYTPWTEAREYLTRCVAPF